MLETIRETSEVPVLPITARGDEIEQVRGLGLQFTVAPVAGEPASEAANATP